jgi:hypothetical protein
MKAWHKVKQETFGEAMLVWRHRATNRFFMKIFSWLLGGYVIGILISILVDTFGEAALAPKAGRSAFLLAFALGVINAFFVNVYNGLKYQVMENALVSSKSLLGVEAFERMFGAFGHLIGNRQEYILWNEIKEMKDEQNALALTLKEDESVALVGVAPVLKLEIYNGGQKQETRVRHNGKFASFSNDEVLDKEALRLILLRAREAKKQAV